MRGTMRRRELAKFALADRGNLPTTPIMQWHSQARPEQSCREHSLIIDALARRDAPRLKSLIALHIRQPQNAAARVR